MKLGVFIAAALCLAPSAYADHLTMIEKYQKAYGETPDPHLLTMIANEYRDAGKPADALAYYCSYIFVAPAGDDADYASAQVHVLKPDAESDHDACTAQKPVAHRDVDTIAAVPKLPLISGREIAGISTIGLGVGMFALALYEGKQGDALYAKINALDPSLPKPSWVGSTEAKAQSYYSRQKWLLAGGGAMAITGSILYLIGRHDRLKVQNKIMGAPNISKNMGGVMLWGTF